MATLIPKYDQGATGAVNRPFNQKLDETVSVKDFGAVGDGTADDTTAIQNAINACQGSTYGTSLFFPHGSYKVTSTLNITGTIALNFATSLQSSINKAFNGNVFTVTAFGVIFNNVSIEGNGATYTGGGICFYGLSYGCLVNNPYISGTADSCIIIDNTPGAAASNLSVTGGTLTAYSSSGASSAGPYSIRLNGPKDASTTNRKFMGITSSTQPLIDLTGMSLTKISDCFTGTINFNADGLNPYVTGTVTGVDSCNEAQISNTYIRDGINISGADHVISNCITHGNYPIYATYAGVPTYSASYGWRLSTGAANVCLSQSNEISNQILDNSPNGLGQACCKYFQNYVPFAFAWTGASADPAIGNGSFSAQGYSYIGANINIAYGVTFGSTTTLGTGQWSFSLPFWTGNVGTSPAIGTWALFLAGGTWKSGFAYVSSTGSTHRISLVDTSGTTLGSTYNGGTIAAGSTLTINMFYARN